MSHLMSLGVEDFDVITAVVGITIAHFFVLPTACDEYLVITHDANYWTLPWWKILHKIADFYP